MFSKNSENSLACIFSLKGLTLSADERALFRDADPFGFILFARNCEDKEQVKKLVADLKEIVGRDCPILIDQEGGRVQRLKPPHWGSYPPMKFYGENPTTLNNDTDRLCGELSELGINVDCAPVMDILTPTTHAVIGDRAFSSDPQIVSRLGIQACERFLKNGITPIIKHIPGHGRAAADSHLELPIVDTKRAELEKTDFYPFKQAAHSAKADAIWAMTAHVIYSDIDPEHPASVSPKIIEDIIRGHMGFEGIILSDDLDMKALDKYGNISEKCNKTLEAGCDLALYCFGELPKMEKIAENCPKLSPNTLKRLQKADKVWNLAA